MKDTITAEEKRIRHQKAWGPLAILATPEKILEWQTLPYGKVTALIRSHYPAGKNRNVRQYNEYVVKIRKNLQIYSYTTLRVLERTASLAEKAGLDLVVRGTVKDLTWSEPQQSTHPSYQSCGSLPYVASKT